MEFLGFSQKDIPNSRSKCPETVLESATGPNSSFMSYFSEIHFGKLYVLLRKRVE